MKLTKYGGLDCAALLSRFAFHALKIRPVPGSRRVWHEAWKDKLDFVPSLEDFGQPSVSHRIIKFVLFEF